MKKILLALLFLSAAALAQTVPVSAVLTDGSGNVVPGAYLHFALWNCGANIPVISGTGSIVQTAFDLKQPGGGGTITGVILGNDQIKCGNVASTQWLVTPMSRQGQPITSAQRYNICSSSAPAGSCAQVGGPGATFDPSTAQPSVTVAPNPGYIQVFGNPLSGQTITQPAGTTLNVFGNMNLNGSAVCTTAICPGGGGGGPPAFYTNLFLNSVQNKLGLNAGAGITLVNDASGNTLITNTNTNVGTVTGVTCGPGLSGGTFSTTGTCAISAPLSVAFGGTGTTSPGLIAGTNVTISGAWPNQTINSSGGGGGGGTGGQYQTAVFNPSNTAVGVGPGIAGQSYISQGGASLPQFASTGLAGRFFLTGTTDQFLCDTSGLTGTTKDRYKRIFINTGGAVTETIPDAGSGGCGGNFTFGVMVGNGTTATINRSSISTFTVCNGSACPSGLTTFTLNAGQYATINSPDNVNYWVVVSPGGGGLTGVAPQQAVFSATNKITGQAKPVYDVRDYSLACDGSTNDTSALSSLISTIGSSPAMIVFPKLSGPCELGSISIPATVDFSGGGSIGLITNPASPGAAALVQASPGTAYTGNSCTATFASNPAAGNAILYEIVYEFGSGTQPGTPTNSANDAFNQLLQSNLFFQSNSASWGAASIAGGVNSKAITVALSGSSTHGVCFAQEVSGLGTGIVVDGKNFGIAGGSSPYSGPMTSTATMLSGDFVLAYGGQGTNNVTCTQGSGFTQPAGTSGNVNGSCMQYQAVSSAGSLTASQAISTTTTDYWVYNVVGIRPGPGTVRMLAGINNPDNHQIFYNATAGLGTIDFTGNYAVDRILPEWWGASGTNSNLTTNTAAVQAAEHGAIGTARLNSSGRGNFNKRLYFGTNFQINGPIHLWDANGFVIECAERLNAGLTQTAANAVIIDGQSTDYGSIHHCAFNSTATDSLPTASVIFDFNGVSTAGDLAPQFLTLYDDSFSGSGLRDVGLLLAPSGGGAQTSNVLIVNNSFAGFTGACFQAGGNGTGRNVGRSYAYNALNITALNGDCQSSPNYGAAFYGAGFIKIDNMSFENGFSAVGNIVGPNVDDVYCEATQGPCELDLVRSESHALAAGNNLEINASQIINQALAVTPGNSDPVGTVIDNFLCPIAWDGKYYAVTVDAGPFGGVGTCSAPMTASSGSTTTVVDTNQTVAGAVTILTIGVGHTVTQGTTGSTGTVLTAPSSTATVTGTLTSGTCNGTEVMTQASSGITGTEIFPTPNNSGPVPLSMVNLSGTADSSHTWTGGTSGCVFTPSAAPTFSASSMLITLATGSPDGTHSWTDGTTSGVFVPSGSPTAQANWTTNQFVGMAVSFLNSPTPQANAGCYGVVTANTATTITASAGWLTKYSQVLCSSPAVSTPFIVEPNWGSATTLYSCATGSTSGACAATGITMVAQSFDVVGGCSGCVGFIGAIRDSYLPGGQIKAAATNSTLQNVFVSRPDWLDNGGNADNLSLPAVNHDWDVQMIQALNNVNGTFYQNWNLPLQTTANAYSGPFQKNLGTKPFCWDAGTAGGSPSVSKTVCIGGRSNPASADTHLEIVAGGQTGAIIGPPVPTSANGVNLAAITQPFSCGRSTGNAAGPSCVFKGSSAGASGTQVNPEVTLATIDGNGIDGPVPTTISTGTTVNLGATYNTGNYYNQEGTAGAGVTYTLPATAVGKRYCVENSGTTGVVNSGVLTIYPPASSFVIYLGVVNTVGGGGTHGIASGGAAGDSACFAAIDATHWEVTALKGTWTEN